MAVNFYPGLAETLRFELLLDSASVHIFSPGTIYSPEFLEENKTKPKITLKIEEAGVGVKPEEAVEALLKGNSKNVCLTLTHSLMARCHSWPLSHIGRFLGNFIPLIHMGFKPSE